MQYLNIGDGIFWSTIILVIFVSIIRLSKYQKWKTFFKGMTVLIVIGTVIGIGIRIYKRYENRPQIMTSLNGIKLGMKELDVTLTKGKPDEILEPKKTGNEIRKIFVYKGSFDSYIHVMLKGKEDSLTVSFVCDHGGYSKALGFGEHSLESEIIRKLGKPSKISINKDRTAKLISYTQWNVVYEISKFSVVAVCVTNSPPMSYVSKYGETSNN